MPTKKKTTSQKKTNKTTQTFHTMFHEFGDALSKVFDDPDLKKAAKEFGKSADKAAKSFVNRFKDDEVKTQFKKVGSATKKFGKQMEREGKKLGKKMEKVGKQIGKDVEKTIKKTKKTIKKK